jgi:ATP-dependent Lhr-like helicase
LLPTGDTPRVETPRAALSDVVERLPLNADHETGERPRGWGVSPGVPQSEQLAETWAEQLLFRYGVVFRDLVQRENITVPWRDILRALRRMEARGSVRGGRFVAGFYGEQYARPEAVESLRKVRRMEKKGELVRVSAVDPLNLVGTITPGPRITAVHTRHVLYRDGIPLSDAEAVEVLDEARVARAG